MIHETNINGVDLEVFVKFNEASHGGNDTPSYDEHNEITMITLKGSDVDIQGILSEDIISQIEKEIGL